MKKKNKNEFETFDKKEFYLIKRKSLVKIYKQKHYKIIQTYSDIL